MFGFEITSLLLLGTMVCVALGLANYVTNKGIKTKLDSLIVEDDEEKKA